MKSTMNVARMAAFGLASILSLTAVGTAAATRPLNSPQGLAVASNGYLYVANNGGNDVLVYNTAHKQVTAKTIVTGVTNPSAVAFDASGNLWVADTGSNQVTEYAPPSFQQTTIVVATQSPYVIAIDGLNDVWANDYETLSVYSPFFTKAIFSLPAEQNNAITGMAMYQGFGVLGTNTGAVLFDVGVVVASDGTNGGLGDIPETCFVATFDSAGTLYCGNLDESVTYRTPPYAASQTLIPSLGAFPSGIAVDKVHGFVYISSAVGNEIFVYNTSGALVTTIK